MTAPTGSSSDTRTALRPGGALPSGLFPLQKRTASGDLLTLWDPWPTAQIGAQVLSPSVAHAETSRCFPQLGPAVPAAQMGGRLTYACQLPPLPAPLGPSACGIRGQTHP